MIRDLLNTLCIDSSILLSELESDVNLDDLGNHPLDLCTSSDSYVQQNDVSRTSCIFPAHNGLGLFGTDGQARVRS